MRSTRLQLVSAPETRLELFCAEHCTFPLLSRNGVPNGFKHPKKSRVEILLRRPSLNSINDCVTREKIFIETHRFDSELWEPPLL